MNVVTIYYSTSSFEGATFGEPVESAVLPRMGSPVAQLISNLGEGTKTIYRLFSSGQAIYPLAKQALSSQFPHVRDAFVVTGSTGIWVVEFDAQSFSKAEDLHRWCLPDWSITVVCESRIDCLENLTGIKLPFGAGSTLEEASELISNFIPSAVATLTHEEFGNRDVVNGWCKAATFKNLLRGPLEYLMGRGVSFSL